jgi:hypothetical protein
MSTIRIVFLLARSALIGWAAMLMVWACYVFLMPHRIESEVGPFGAFFIFGLVFSAVYLADFVLLALPMYFLYVFDDKEEPVRRWQWAICGGVLFLLSVLVWCYAFHTHSDWQFYLVAATGGAASVYVMPFQVRQRGQECLGSHGR